MNERMNGCSFARIKCPDIEARSVGQPKEWKDPLSIGWPIYGAHIIVHLILQVILHVKYYENHIYIEQKTK